MGGGELLGGAIGPDREPLGPGDRIAAFRGGLRCPPPGHRWTEAEQRQHFIEDLHRFAKSLQDERELLERAYGEDYWELKIIDGDLESTREEIEKREAELADSA